MQNANDGISMAQTAESAMGSITDTLQTMRDLAVEASNSGVVGSGDRQKLQNEFQQLGLEIGRVIQNTQFNGKSILAGSLVGATFQVGPNASVDNQISLTVSNLTTVSGVKSLMGNGMSIGSATGSLQVRSVISQIDVAIAAIDKFRSTLGAMQNRFTMTISNLQSSIQNQTAARSRIMDTDFAATTSQLSKDQILQQAGTAMLAQANQSGQSVLKLLQ
jgi:flagellin